MRHNLNAVMRISARDLIPGRYYALFLAVVFLISLVTAYLTLPVFNALDWHRTAQQLRNMTRGDAVYCDPFCRTAFDADLLPADHDPAQYVTAQAYSPWILWFLGPLMVGSARLLIALSVAVWVVIVFDLGRLSTLILFLHPAFIMVWAAANIDLVVNGVGLWLILRGVRGWRRGVALLLLTIKPHVLIVLVLLEGVRMVWERDRQALLVVALVVGVSVALFPRYLTETVPSYLDIAGGSEVIGPDGKPEETLSYSFSVMGAWGPLAALGIMVLMLALMRRRLTEWRTLAVLLSFVWTPHLGPVSYAVLLILFYRTPLWRTGLYLLLSLALLPVLFTDFHSTERIGTLLFVLLAALLTPPDAAQTEEAIARRHDQPVFPPARPVVRRLA